MKNKYNIIIFGSGIVVLDCIEKLKKNKYNVVFVYTIDDVDNSDLIKYLQEEKIQYSFEDLRLNNESFDDLTSIYQKNIIISINYKYIIPIKIIEKVKFAFNIHGSLLPKYRGRTPHVWSIINGETRSGITSHILNESVDTGDIIIQKEINICELDTGYTLLMRIFREYPNILIESLERLKNGEELIKQKDSNATYFGIRKPIMGYIDLRKNSKDVINFIRAQATPYPSAYYFLKNGKKIYIDHVKIVDIDIDDIEIGEIKNIEGFYYMRCLDNVLKVEDYYFNEVIF